LSNRIIYTIEFYPEEGKYHFSGHRNCKTSFSPTEVAEKGTVCPVCRREMTEGVAVRIEQLAGASFAEEYTEKVSESGVKWYTDKIQSHPPYVKLVRLEQIIAAGLGMTPNSIKVKNLYTEMCKVDAEITLLLKTPLDQFGKIVRQLAGEQADKISESLSKVRRGEITVNPGFDGEYGKVEIWKEGENVQVSKEVPKAQLSLEF
jgi:PHP family Zn ribbon phosphoesterase